MPSKKLQNIDVSSIGRETLQMRNTELEVYTWKDTVKRSKVHF